MTNLEFYKEEIWDILTKRLQHSPEESVVYSSLTECYKKHTDATVVRLIDLISWACEEHKEPILTEEEKEYLNAVIKPFKNKEEVAIVISKVAMCGVESLEISIKRNFDFETILCFPPFEKDTMYKGMKPNKCYTLKELGL